MAKMRVPASFDKVYATNQQLLEAETEVKELEGMLEEDRRRKSPRISSVEDVKKQIVKRKRFIKEFKPAKARGQNANRMYAEAKKLREEIANAMPTAEKYFQRDVKNSDNHTKAMEFERAVQQQIKFQTSPDMQRKVVRYKHIMARIDPSDPTIRNIESLRRLR